MLRCTISLLAEVLVTNVDHAFRMCYDFPSIIKRLSTLIIRNYGRLFKLTVARNGVAGNGVTFLREPIKSIQGTD